MRYKDTDLREQRDRAIFDAYNKALVERGFESQAEAVEYVRTHSAPRFFISAEFCAIVISRLAAGKHPGVSGYQRIRKFRELYRRYLIETDDPKNANASLREICGRIVDQEAPEFYLNFRATSEIINRQREARQERLARYFNSE